MCLQYVYSTQYAWCTRSRYNVFYKMCLDELDTAQRRVQLTMHWERHLPMCPLYMARELSSMEKKVTVT